MPATTASRASLTVPPPALPARLELGQVGARDREAAVGGDRAVERRHRRLRARVRASSVTSSVARAGRAAAPARARVERARGRVEHQALRAQQRRRASQARDLERAARSGSGAHVAVGRVDVERLLARVEQHRADVDRRDAVHERVVHLRHERDAAARQPVDDGGAPTAAASGPGAARSRAPRRPPARRRPPAPAGWRGARAIPGRSRVVDPDRAGSARRRPAPCAGGSAG